MFFFYFFYSLFIDVENELTDNKLEKSRNFKTSILIQCKQKQGVGVVNN